MNSVGQTFAPALGFKSKLRSRCWLRILCSLFFVGASATLARALTLSYSRLPMQISTAITPLTPTLVGAVGGTTYALTTGALPTGLSLNTTDGSISGTPTATGTFNARVTATNGATTAYVDLVLIVFGAPAGPSADRPVYQMEVNGVSTSPWGAGFYAWPKQLFWQNVEELATSALGEMRASAAGWESGGLVPVIGCVGWGYEYYVATGQDPNNNGYSDYSNVGGWGQWGQFMKNHPKYQSTNNSGVAEPGYFTPMMPMDPADWPNDWTSPAGWIAPSGWVNGKPTTTVPYAQWLGIRLAQLGLYVGARGIYCADYVVGLEWGDLVDFNQRVIDDFAKWANVTIPSGTIAAQADYIGKNHKRLYNDFRGSRFAQFYGSTAQNLHDNGKSPMVGGQLPADPAIARCYGDDIRLFIHSPDGVPAQYHFFNLELQADFLRPAGDYWLSSIHTGATASWEPDMPLGSVMDAADGDGSFAAALANAGHDAAWGAKHIRHQWLSAGWAHIAGRDGTVRRAIRAFTRSYWDAGTPPANEVALIFGHIPRHPFGPAFYYSSAIMRSFEVGNGAGQWAPFWRLIREIEPLYNSDANIGRAAGLCTGYFVSDVGFQKLKPADFPSA